MKAGLMEVADLFVVNKADRPGADRLKKEIIAAGQPTGNVCGIHVNNGYGGVGSTTKKLEAVLKYYLELRPSHTVVVQQ